MGLVESFFYFLSMQPMQHVESKWETYESNQTAQDVYFEKKLKNHEKTFDRND